MLFNCLGFDVCVFCLLRVLIRWLCLVLLVLLADNCLSCYVVLFDCVCGLLFTWLNFGLLDCVGLLSW